MSLLEYDDFDVLIERSGNAFEARVVNSPTGGTPAVSFVPPVSDEKLENLALKMRTVPGMRGFETDTAPDTKQIGSALFDALFHDKLLDRLRNSLTRTNDRRHGLRIRLRFSDAHELWNVPWEFLYDRENRRFLCQFDTTPIVRYVDIAQPVEPLTVHGPIQMLVMISSPGDYPSLDVEKEWQQLSEVLKPLEDTGSLTVQRLPTASLAELNRAVMFGEFHVFHYIGHGGLDRQSGDGLLVLTDANRRSQLVTGEELFVMLARSPIRLAVLNSCLGSRISAIDPYAGTAATLVHQGIPAVVAMQFEISDPAAMAFSRTLYEAIAYGWPVDMAVCAARRAILATSRSEWATPVLYLRAPDGKLLEVTKPDRAPAPAAPTGLDGSLSDRVVTLNWADVAAGLTPVSHWELRRDGTPVCDVTASQARDEPPGPGRYEYTVVAVGADGQRSAESAAWTVKIPDLTPALPPPQPLAVPTGLSGSIAAGRVNLHWDPPMPGSPEVARWEVRRDGTLIADVTEPEAHDELFDSGSYTYTVIAVGEDEQRSDDSAGWTAVVSVVMSPPAVPTGLTGSITNGHVDLRWDPPIAGSIEVARWEILRDGAPITEATSPSFTDTPGPGLYPYTVRAVGADGQRSPESVSYLAKITGPRWRWLVILAAVVVLAGLLVWWVLRPDPLSPPTGLSGTTADNTISLEWDQAPPDSPPVSEWEVRRNGEVVATPTTPQFADNPGPGTYSYTVVAVGEDGERSAESDSFDATVDGPETTARWENLEGTGFEEPFNSAGVAEHKGELWVVGGTASGEDRPLNQVRVFNPQTEEWGDGPTLPVGVQHAALVSTGDELFLLGGLTKSDPGSSPTSLRTVYRLDPPTREWVEHVPLPEPRFAGSAAWDGQRLVFAGGAGWDPRTAAADIWALEGGVWERIEGLQQPREHLAAVTNEDGTVWFVGGADVGRKLVFDDVDMVSGDAVTENQAINTALEGIAAIWTPETGICTFGGSPVLPNAEAAPVDAVACQGGSEPPPDWPPLPKPRAGAVAAIVDGTVYVVGGYSPKDDPDPLQPAEMVMALR